MVHALSTWGCITGRYCLEDGRGPCELPPVRRCLGRVLGSSPDGLTDLSLPPSSTAITSHILQMMTPKRKPRESHSLEW